MSPAETARRPAVALDPEAILAPLAGPSPAGPDLGEAVPGPFAAVAEARREDDSLDQGVWVRDRKLADWSAVVALCQEALATRTKDLRLLAWLVEALVERDGFAALAPGLDLIERFCQTFWPDLHPAIDSDGDLTARVNVISWLNSRLPPLLRTKPVTASGFAEPVRLTWGDYEMARLYQARGAQGPSLTAFQASADATPLDQLDRLRRQIGAGLEATERLDHSLDALCGSEAPSLVDLKTLLGDMMAWLDATLPPPRPAAAETEPMEDESPAPPPPPPPARRDGAAAIASREDAYRRLAEVADYLMRAEPHSPAPYVLRRVLAWSNMPLQEVLLEMASGRNDLSSILDLISFRE